MKYSLNDRLILEIYKTDGSLKTEIKNGIAFVQQKIALKGLKVKMNTTLSNGTKILAGSIAYLKEEDLHNREWAKKPLTCDALSEPFIIVDSKDVQFIVDSEE